ncbi:endo-1,4-beta-xylanase [Massilibacteroides sp.]|uniref:endo-1,4-beta-xylanase n=1 Tax=Massilibacteroides sp. TaxID=2034766 RepID=UPI002635D681|nr:endo-1,4-beta-xylanase [Massilibacteroides sp.]MDD4515501.1 endo-1,4-beta-xylanase [Massilibacteroides sp.]
MKTLVLIFFCVLFSARTEAQQPFPKSANEDKEKIMGDSYWQLWNPQLQLEIDKNIEKYRKANGEISLTDLNPGTDVKIEQISHHFLFGAHIFNFDQLGADDLNKKYKDLYGTLFNSATIAFYWKTFEPEPGKPRYKTENIDEASYWNKLSEPWKEFHWRRPSPEKVIEFCEEKGIQMHAHPLIWGNTRWNHPEWISKEPNNVNQMERLFEKRINEITTYYKDRLPSWDIVNESVDPTPGKPRYGVIPEDYTYKSFKWAEKGFPSSVMFNINDSWRTVYPPFIKGLIDRGAKIDVIGLQMHIFSNAECGRIAKGEDVIANGTSWQPKNVIGYLEELDKLERPIHLSEITIPAPGKDDKSEKIQAIMAQNMYRLWFSWPSIFRITWWNVVDDCGAAGEPTTSGLFNRQMQPKQAFHALNNLINNEWKTNITIKSDKTGKIKFRGFKGSYRITWKDKNGKTQTTDYYLNN